MKNILRKNQIIITALVIMIAVAGYLSLTGKEIGKEAGSSDVSTGDVNMEISDEDSNSQEVASGAATTSEDISDTDEGLSEALKQDASKKNAGDAVLVNNTISSDYFESARLSREQTRSQNKESLMELVNNANTSKKQKENAVNEIVALTNAAEKETAAENLLEAKGFKDVVVSIVEDSADVIINANTLTEQQIAQVQDIVKRKTDIASDKIVITPVGVE